MRPGVELSINREGFRITRSHLVCGARDPGVDHAAFIEHGNAAKAGCPASRALAGVEITVEAKLAVA